MADSLDYVKICESCPPGDGWGPPVTDEITLNGVPYAPFSKGDKLGRMADWTAEGKDRERGGRMQYNRQTIADERTIRKRTDQQVYGTGHAVVFNAPPAEDETSFSVVSNVRDSAKSKFGRGAIFTRGRGQRGGRGDTRGGRGGHRAQGSGGALDWRTKLVTQRGAVVTTEMKNNSCKLARWTTQSILSKSDVMKLGFVSRANPRSNDKHVILGVIGWKPRDFANQMNLSLSNGWGIVRTIADMCLRSSEQQDGKFVLVKDPNKAILRLYQVPAGSFEDDDEEGEAEAAAEEAEE
ncbi:hypothetical protein M440DRAFT_1387462 [Trichoderma longibrachiatum ATCC 18648]|uniref:Eukaryotic translation initiation factor 3 subunit D n=1 Tax=Trichoderma longibrachiatum ATCC 18648 TaxID=983965 RepID=A0A2T4CHB6_TRILO|nr:hypothetical protein M440DRAFT_1387462 [Trichoderma longibrachiatum ATCC 18648]